MSNEEDNFETSQQELYNKVAVVEVIARNIDEEVKEVKEYVRDFDSSGSSSSTHYWVALGLMVLMSGLVTMFVMRAVTNDQGNIVEIIRNAPSAIESAVESAIEGETVSMAIIEGVNEGIEDKISELNEAIAAYEEKLEEVSKDEGDLTKFCPGFNRSGNRETFKLAQMLAFDKSDTDLSFSNAKQICTLNAEGCMVCRVLGRTKPCDYTASGGCNEVAHEVNKNARKETAENICGSFTKDSAGWDKSSCSKQ